MPARGVSPAAREYLRRVPKVELHVHLEGALGRERLFHIASRHGLHPGLRRPEDLDVLYHHADFDDFLQHFKFAVQCLRDVEDVHAVALDLFAALLAQNVVYAEIIFSAGIFTRSGMPLEELLAAVVEAEAEALAGAPSSPGAEAPAAAGRPRFNLVIDLVRNFGTESAARLVEDLARLGHRRVVGVHLGGDEVGYPARLFVDAFRAARQAGLGLAAHAGEADGPASVRAAIDLLGVTRIGHGVRSVEDPALLDDLVRRRITLEVCPTSNVCTRVVPSLAAHPLPEFLRRGIAVSIGSDDPSFFDTDISREMHRAHAELGLGLSALDAMTDAGLAAAFLPAEERDRRLCDLRRARAELQCDLGLPPTA